MRSRVTLAVAPVVAVAAAVGTVLSWRAGTGTASYPDVSDGSTRIAGAYTVTTHDGAWLALATLLAIVVVVAVFVGVRALSARRSGPTATADVHDPGVRTPDGPPGSSAP